MAEYEDRKPARLLQWVLAMPLILMPVLLGGARPWLWSSVAAVFLIGLAAIIWVQPDLRLTTNIPRKWLFVLLVLLAYPFFQVIPLPAEWLSALSPVRFFWLEKAREVSALKPWPETISYAPLTTFFKAIWWVFLVLFALLFRRVVRSGSELHWLFVLLFVLAGLEAFYGLMQVLIPTMGVIGAGDVGLAYAGFARGTFNNRNHFACFLAMLWPLLIARTLGLNSAFPRGKMELSFTDKERRREIRQKQIFLWFVVGLVFLALLFSASRGGILSACIGLTVFAALGGTRRKGIVAFVVGCWALVAVYGSIIGFDEIIRRFDLIQKDAPGRFMIWETCRRIICDHFKKKRCQVSTFDIEHGFKF